jgi:hypothetical protein
VVVGHRRRGDIHSERYSDERASRIVEERHPPVASGDGDEGELWGVLEQSCETRHRRDTILLTIE